jgi:hypothetical protein
MTNTRLGSTSATIVAGVCGLTVGLLVGMPGWRAAHGVQEAHGAQGMHDAQDAHAAQAAPAAHDAHAQSAKDTENWSPVAGMHLYLCAFHTAKENPNFQVEAHHYCSPCGKDLHQCVIFDRSGPTPKLLGIEYIIPDEVYQTLPADERKYWHPHAYEILSGQLIAPELPKDGDEALSGLIKTWGKTWHTWRDPATPLPMGEPLLMWSANGDGQIQSALVDGRDKRFGISTATIRERRKSMGFAVPQIPPPKSVGEPGRRWTPSGPDEPVRMNVKAER